MILKCITGIGGLDKMYISRRAGKALYVLMEAERTSKIFTSVAVQMQK